MKNSVLESTRALTENPKYVFINYKKAGEVAQRFAQEEMKIPTWESPVHLNSTHSTSEVIDYFMLADSINFAFTDFKTKQKYTSLYQGREFRGAYGMHACLKRAYDEGKPILDGEFLANISKKEMKEIFTGNITIPLFRERLDIFREVGEILYRKYDRHFHNLIAQSGNRLFSNGEGIVERLVNDFHSFDDSTKQNGQKVCFYKRAQLAPAMLYGRFQNTDEFPLKDVEELTIFADYVLPRGLRYMSVLEYEKSLAERVDNQQIIPAHSQEELEIRASTIHAANIIMEEVNKTKSPDKKINAIHMDAKLWLESRNPKGTPHHLTPTIAY
tara:strand:- start:1601 stop:2587 length:987 start_codon:yes stop_codon:yes gene_type:complete